MTAGSKGKVPFLNWRLCLQTSGIYRDPAIPGRQVKVKVKTHGRLMPPAWSGPGVGAQVSSLQSLTLRPGQEQRRTERS